MQPVTLLRAPISVSQVHTHEDHPQIPEGACRVTFQGEQGQLTLLVDDPPTVAELLTRWEPYRVAVHEITKPDSDHPLAAWPAAPTATLTVELE